VVISVILFSLAREADVYVACSPVGHYITLGVWTLKKKDF